MVVVNGAKETRTPDPLHAMQVLYQLSYGPSGMFGEDSPGDPVKITYSRSLTRCARPAQCHARAIALNWQQLTNGGLRGFICWGTALLATLWNLASAAQAQPFNAVVVFGDSLSDPGNTADLQNRQVPPHLQYPEGTNFSTNPDWVWTQYVEQFYGGPGEYRSLGRGGTNYAMGGACISTDLDSTTGCSQQGSVQGQMMRHFADGGRADPDSLYIVWGGSNDLHLVGPRGSLTAVGHALGLGYPSAITDSVHMLSNQLNNLSRLSRRAALDYLKQIKFLQDQGAENIVILNMPPLGFAPGVRQVSEALSDPPAGLEILIASLVASDLRLDSISTFINKNAADEFNQTLANGLKSLDHGIIVIDVYDFVEDIIKDPESYGFTNITQAACRQTSVFSSEFSELPFFNDACGPAHDEHSYPYTYDQGTDATYLFADNVHPSGAANRMLADLVIATISASAQVSLPQVDQDTVPKSGTGSADVSVEAH